MSAFDEIRSITTPTDLDLAVMFYGDEQTASDEDIESAERAANELLDLRRRVAELEGKINCDASIMTLDGHLITRAMILLGMDVSGSDSGEIIGAIKRLQQKAAELEVIIAEQHRYDHKNEALT